MLTSAIRPAALVLLALCFSGPSWGQVWSEPVEIWPPSLVPPNHFGRAVDLSGDTLAVSHLGWNAPWSSCSAIVEDRVHVLRRGHGGPGVWGFEASIDSPVPTCTSGATAFGQDLALDGDTLVVGGPGYGFAQEGVAFVFVRGANALWSLAAQLDPPVAGTSMFGTSVAVSGDTVVVGSYGQLAAIYERGSSSGFPLDKVLPAGSESLFGSAVGLDGDTLAVGAGWAYSGPGAVYLFERDLGGPGNWGLEAVVRASQPATGDNFGTSLALDGDRLVVSSLSGTGLPVHVFERNSGGPGNWGLTTLLPPSGSPPYGIGEQLDLSGDHLVVNTPLSFGSGGTCQTYAPGPSGAWLLTGEFFPQAGIAIGDAVAIEGSRLAMTSFSAKVGSFNWTHLEAVAYDSASGLMYAAGPDDLMSYDPVLGTGQSIGQPPDKLLGLAFDASAATLYATLTGGPDQLAIIDPVTAQVTQVGPIDAGGYGFNNVAGLAFHPGSGVLYGVDRTTDQLLTIDTATGAGVPVGSLGGPGDLRSLACDPVTGTLYAVDETLKMLYSIDPATGQSTPVGPVAWPVRGLAWNSAANALLGVGTGAQPLVQLDPLTGSSTIVQHLFLPGVGRTDVHERIPPTPYCTAGTSSGGCRAELESFGFPKPAGTNPFLIRAQGFEGAQPSVLFYGTSGRQANPWGNGTSLQCVTPPLTRAPALSPTGTPGACDASVEVDLNALWASHPNKYPGPGAVVQTQLWYLDPSSTSNQSSALSSALEIHTAP